MFRQKKCYPQGAARFLSELLLRQYGTSYHIAVEVTQKRTWQLPEDGIVLPKHVGAIV
jgi:hypothetical protein